LKIEAKLELICVCPHTIKQNGKALFKSPTTKRACQCCAVFGKGSLSASIMAHKPSAARPTRNVTIVSGGRYAIKTSTKKNEPPQSTDKMTNILMSATLICWLIVFVIYWPCPIAIGATTRFLLYTHFIPAIQQ